MNQIQNIQNDERMYEEPIACRPTIIQEFQTPKMENKHLPLPKQLLEQKIVH
jgi:hypothetical protein